MSNKSAEILKSIYESIDDGKFSLAIKQCSRKEVCRDETVKALKTYALFRNGEREDALKLVQQLIYNKSVDEYIYSIIKPILRNKNHYELELEALNSIVNSDSLVNIQIQFCDVFLFMKDYRKLQSHCILLNKLTNDIKYLEWCGISMYFQAMKGSILMYDLCEKTLIKTLNDKCDSELLRFICILYEKKKQYEESINLLKLHPVKEEEEREDEEKDKKSVEKEPPFWKNISRPFNYQYYNELLGEYQLKSNKYHDSESTYEKLLKNCIDIDWNIYKQYIDIIIINNKISDESVERMKEKINEIKTIVEKRDNKNRYGSLMFVYFYYTLYLHTDDSKYIKVYLDCLNSHIEKYKHYCGCFHDIKPYLSLLIMNDMNEDNKIHLSEDIIMETLGKYVEIVKNYNNNNGGGDDIVKGKDLFNNICYIILLLQIIRYCGYTFNKEDENEEEMFLKHLYNIYIDSNTKLANTVANEQYINNLLLYIIFVLREKSLILKDKKYCYLINCSMLCNIGLKNYKGDNQLRFISVSIDNEIGNIVNSQSNYKMMRISNIQYDTLNYIELDNYLYHMNYSNLEDLSESMVRFYIKSDKEITESILTAMDNRTYSRIPEFLEFQNSLTHSISFVKSYNYYILSFLYMRSSSVNDINAAIKSCLIGDLKYNYLFNQSEIPSYENHNNYNPLIQWDKIYTKTNHTNDVYYVEQLPIQRFYILFPKLLHYIIESSADELKKIKIQLDDIFNEENREKCNKYEVNIAIVMKLMDLIVSVLNKDYKNVENVINELNKSFDEFKVIINELLNEENVILDIEKVKQMQFFISVISFITSEIFITLSKPGTKKNIPQQYVTSLHHLLVNYQEILKLIVEKCNSFTKSEKKDVEMSYIFANCDCSDVISAVVRGNIDIVNNIMKQVTFRQNLTHKVKI